MGKRPDGGGGRSGEVEPVRVVVASCRHAVSRIGRGKLGGAATAELLAKALADVVPRGLPDVSGSATEVFAALVSLHVLDEMPCLRVRGPALRLLAAATPLVAAHGSRRWNLWFASALDPRGEVFAALRAGTPRSVVEVQGAEVGQAAPAPAHEELAARLEALHVRLAALVQEKAAAIAERDAAREMLMECGEEKRALAEELAGLQERAAELERTVRDLAGKDASAVAERAGMLAERDAAVRRAEALEVQLAAKMADLGKLERSVDEARREREEARKVLTERAGELERLYRVILGELDPLGAAPASVEGVRRVLNETRGFFQAVRSERDRLEAELRSVRPRVDSLAAELSEERARGAREQEKFTKDARAFEARANEVDRLRAQVAAATRDPGELKKALERATAAEKALREASEAHMVQIEAARVTIVDLCNDVVQLDMEIELRRHRRAVDRSMLVAAREHALKAIKGMPTIEVVKMLASKRLSR